MPGHLKRVACSSAEQVVEERYGIAHLFVVAGKADDGFVVYSEVSSLLDALVGLGDDRDSRTKGNGCRQE